MTNDRNHYESACLNFVDLLRLVVPSYETEDIWHNALCGANSDPITASANIRFAPPKESQPKV